MTRSARIDGVAPPAAPYPAAIGPTDPRQRGPELLRVTNLTKEYLTYEGDLVAALPGIDITLGDGEFVSVVGPSGCGKTTLLKILAGIVSPTSGEVRFRGEVSRAAQSNMGVVFQSPVLMPWLTVLDNVLLPARILKLDLRKARQTAAELLALVGLEDFGNKYPFELSGGMQQRAAIVRGLIHDPGILLMDEPFGALDALTRERMNFELQRIWMARPKTVFFITHSIPESVFLSDRVLVMSARPGRIVKEFAIPFARPRALNLTGTAEFGAIAGEIRHLLGDD